MFEATFQTFYLSGLSTVESWTKVVFSRSLPTVSNTLELSISKKILARFKSNLFLQRQLRSVQDGLNPVGVEAGFDDVGKRRFDRRLNDVDVVHRDALEADTEHRVSRVRVEA